MREIIKLHPQESMSQSRLVFEESWLDKFNTLTVYLVFSPFILLPVEMYLNESFINPNERFILYCVLPISVLSGLYIYYRSATEKRLTKIHTSLKRQDARQLLLNYAEKKGYEIYLKSNDCLIFNETYDDWNSNYKKTRIFFVQDKIIMFCIIRDSFKINMPILFSHLFLKVELKKLVKEKGVENS